jgi:hypothetical protein
MSAFDLSSTTRIVLTGLNAEANATNGFSFSEEVPSVVSATAAMLEDASSTTVPGGVLRLAQMRSKTTESATTLMKIRSTIFIGPHTIRIMREHQTILV